MTGALIVVALILLHAVVFFPAEIVNATAGLAFGFWVAFPIVLVSWVVSGLIAYWLGSVAGRPLAVRLAGEKRVAHGEQLIDRSGAPALLALAAGPVRPVQPRRLPGRRRPRAAVALHVDVVRGVMPITAAATYLGHALDDLSASDPIYGSPVS